jgi:hypothetical protein
MASSDGGTVRPSIRAVWALMTSSNLLDCTTGKVADDSVRPVRPRLIATRLRRIYGVFLKPAATDSGVEHAGSPCRSIRSLWGRCRCLCNCLDPLRLERTPTRLASLFRHPARARINYDLRGLAVWVVVSQSLGPPA